MNTVRNAAWRSTTRPTGGRQGCPVQLAAERHDYGHMIVTGRQSLFRLRIPPKEFLGFGKGQESGGVNRCAPPIQCS